MQETGPRVVERSPESSATLVECSEETTLKWSSDCFAHVGPRKHVRQPLARAKQGRQSCLQQGWEYEHASRHLTSGWRATERTVEQGHETSWQDVSCREGNLWAKEARAKTPCPRKTSEEILSATELGVRTCISAPSRSLFLDTLSSSSMDLHSFVGWSTTRRRGPE